MTHPAAGTTVPSTCPQGCEESTGAPQASPEKQNQEGQKELQAGDSGARGGGQPAGHLREKPPWLGEDPSFCLSQTLAGLGRLPALGTTIHFAQSPLI